MPRFIDLSHPLADGVPNFPNGPQLSVKVHTTIPASGYKLSHVSLSSHQGTHLDAPFRLYDDGATLDRIPLERFCGPATLVDLAPGGIGDDSGHPLRDVAFATEPRRPVPLRSTS